MKPSRPLRVTRSVLRLFTDVHEGEEVSALLLLANVFLVLCAYYFIKPLREGWISISELGDVSTRQLKAYTSFGQALFLIPVVAAYARYSGRWQRSALITRATLFCMSHMVIFWALQPGFFIKNLAITGVAFYLWVGMFGVFVVAQFWCFAADVYTKEQGKRLLPLVAIGATAGAAFGSEIAGWLVRSQLVGTEWLLIAALVPLSISIALTRAVDRREANSSAARESVPKAPEPGNSGGESSASSALSLIFSSRFLIAVAAMTFLLNWVNTNGENILFWVVQDFLDQEAAEAGIRSSEELLHFTRDRTTIFYASFFGLVNWLALGLQAFAASRILKYRGFATLLLIFPVVAMFSYIAMALVPILAVVKMMKVVENATDYSLNNTARSVLWLVVDSSVIYRAKPAVDTLFVRLGDGLAALTILVGDRLLELPVENFIVFNLTLVIFWILLSLAALREHRVLEEGSTARV